MATMYSFGERIVQKDGDQCISLATSVQIKSSKMRKKWQYIYF